MKGKLFDLSVGLFGKRQRLTLEIDGDFRKEFDDLRDKDIEITIKQWKPKRSQNANAYLWELIGKLAEVMNLSSVEVYRLAINAVGVWKDFPPLPRREAETLKTAWQNLGLGWQTDVLDYDQDGDSVIVRCYYGSSVYNTKQMSRLLDYVIQDCRAVDIETRTPEEIAILKASWKGAKIDV